MKLIKLEELSQVMPMFEKFAKRSKFDQKLDLFSLFNSLSSGISTGSVNIITNEDFTKMIYIRFIYPELENKAKQSAVNAVWVEDEGDEWIKEAIEHAIETIIKPAGAEELYINVYPKSKGMYKSLKGKLLTYETAHIYKL